MGNMIMMMTTDPAWSKSQMKFETKDEEKMIIIIIMGNLWRPIS